MKQPIRLGDHTRDIDVLLVLGSEARRVLGPGRPDDQYELDSREQHAGDPLDSYPPPN